MRPRRSGPIRRRGDQIDPPKVLNEQEKTALETYLKNRWLGGKKPQNKADMRAFKDLLIYELLLATGIRRSELCDLRLKDTPEWIGESAIYVYCSKKTKKDRTIPLSNRLVKLVKLYIDNYRRMTLPRYVQREDGDKPLFYSQRQKPYLENSVYRKAVKWGKAAGVKKQITPHKFRHTFATDSLLDEHSRISIYELQYLLGHKSTATTMKYVHYVIARRPGMGEVLDRRGRRQSGLKGQDNFPYA